MISSIKEDIYRNFGLDYKNLKVRIRYVLHPVNRQLVYFRLAQNNKFAKFWDILLKVRQFHTGVQIPSKTRIGRGLRILHFGNIVINPDAEIGDNFNIAQGCLVGSSFVKGTGGTPKIGNNVCMFANSVVVGGVNIGDDVLIAPGAFVDFDVPPNSVVIGNPGRIIEKKESPTQKYIVFSVYNMK